MREAGVVDAIVTVCVEAYVPPAGENFGVAAVMTYAADPTLEFVKLVAVAMALMVWLLATVIGLE
jgi:hypothetical protein